MSDDAQEWRWVGEDGVEKTVTEQELIAELSSESLPNYTLVWKRTWLEWLPAMQVAELGWALPPGKTDEPVKAREKATALTPPAPPLYRYPVVKRRASNLRSEKPGAPRAAAVAAPRPTPKKTEPSPLAPSAAATSPLAPSAAATSPLAPSAAATSSAASSAAATSSAATAPRPLDPIPPPPRELWQPAAEAEKTEPRRLPVPEPPTTELRPLDSKPVEEVDFDAIEASRPSNPLASDDDHPLPRRAPVEEATLVRDDDDGALVAEDDEAESSLPSEAPPAGSGGGFSGFEAVRGGFRSRAYGEEDDAETRVIPSKPPPPPGALYVGPHAPPASERPPPHFEEASFDELEEMPRFPAPLPPPADLAAYANIAPAPGTPRADRPRGGYALGGAAALVVLVIGVLLARRSSDAPATGTAVQGSASASPEASAPATASALAPRAAVAARPTGKPCMVTTAATRVADWAEPSIAPAFAAVPGSQRVVVGFGQSDTYAVGITIDPRTLDRDQVFREFRKQKLVSVVPTADQGKLHFQVVRAGFPLGNARAVDAPTPFFIGATAAAISEVVGKNDPSSLWSFPDADQATVPRVATIPGVGHAVTFRRGGKTGRVAVGWLNPSGLKKTELVDVRTEDDFSGTPAIAANGDSILVAFASRGSSAPAWGIAIASAKSGQLPTSAARFVLPPGGPGGDAMSPTVAALSGGRWLLQWTEGPSGKRIVRAAVLDETLALGSDAVSLSPDGANAGQGAVWATGDQGAVLFYVANDKKSHELWGAAIECPR